MAVVPHWFRNGCCQTRTMKTRSMLSCKPWCHAEMVDMRMRDDRIRDPWCFVWITWRVGWCKAIVKEKFGSRWVFHHDPNIAYFVSTTKAMEPETLFGRK